MILQAKGGCYLTEAADVKIEQRHFAQTVYLGAADEALAWREVTEAEKEKMLQQGTVFDTSQLSGEYLDKVDALMLAIHAQINDAAPLPEAEALEHIGWYPEWGDENAPMGKEVDAGFRLRNKGRLFKVRQPHTLQEQWEPGAEGTEAIYTLLQADHEEHPGGHAGTIDDPIPYEGNMMLEQGKYYVQDGVTYLCTRDSGIPMTHALSELVGQYVEKVETVTDPGTEEN